MTNHTNEEIAKRAAEKAYAMLPVVGKETYPAGTTCKKMRAAYARAMLECLPYMRHKIGCPTTIGSKNCTCGLDKLLNP